MEEEDEPVKGKGKGKAKEKKKREWKALRADEDEHPAARVHWWRVVLDESHNIKDPNTLANKACTGLMVK